MTGPFRIKDSKVWQVNKRTKMKVRVIIYCCMNTGLVYINIISKQDTEAFLMVWKSFIKVAKSTRLCSCAFLLVVNAGKLCPRDRSQAQLTGATWSDNNTE